MSELSIWFIIIVWWRTTSERCNLLESSYIVIRRASSLMEFLLVYNIKYDVKYEEYDV